MKENLLTLIDDMLKEDMGAVDEFIEEEIKPIADYLKAQRKKQLEKEYEEVLRMEEEIKQ
jgi:hypothetical protein